MTVKSLKSALTKGEKKVILVTCLASLCIGNMMIHNIAGFLPTFIKDNNEEGKWKSDDDYLLNSSDIALIISMFSIA